MEDYERMMIEQSLEDEAIFKELRENCPREFMNIISDN